MRPTYRGAREPARLAWGASIRCGSARPLRPGGEGTGGGAAIRGVPPAPIVAELAPVLAELAPVLRPARPPYSRGGYRGGSREDVSSVTSRVGPAAASGPPPGAAPRPRSARTSSSPSSGNRSYQTPTASSGSGYSSATISSK